MSTTARRFTARQSGLAQAVGASLIGTTIEWYDFFLYSLASATVFAAVFFPTTDRLTGTLLSFATYAIGFAARPLGALVFGHFGDRLGRKRLLVISLVTMGAATALIGALPTYATAGVWAPILLTALRLIQGFALGGEWGGAVLLVAERGEAKRRGFWTSWPQGGAALGFVLAALALTVISHTQTTAQVLDWGWRIPFLASAVLVAIGLWLRLSLEESPVFWQAQAEVRASGTAEPSPLVGVLRHHWRDVLVAIGIRMAENISFYIVGTFVIDYAVLKLGLNQTDVLNCVLIAATVEFCAIPCWGALSDRLGRKPVYLIGSIGMGIWAWIFFGLIDTKNYTVIALAIVVALLLHSAMYAPQAAYVSEMFGTRMRYSGASIGAQLASLAAGAPAPLIAVALLKDYGTSTPIALYLSAACVITTVTLLFAKETKGRDLTAVTPGSGSAYPPSILAEPVTEA
ncbi:MHS family MFS transporter [Actinospica sp. MGRD01-02]|uniref:Putative proline/betaine transporter n=1 Tax=Actinospica acidithermotolerans TaxID=2828514 RepID=A0A941EE26_9ACTN|nr:MFS transporter [Actinospica acidithermotolerans]MBR7831005.1 MHS family MFS transporter [Actinospica acidithermotolerans]